MTQWDNVGHVIRSHRSRNKSDWSRELQEEEESVQDDK